MLNRNNGSGYGNLSSQLSREFRFDPQRQAELSRLTKKAAKQTHIYQLDQIKKYVEINRPFVGQQKRKMIEEKLELEMIAEKLATARIKNKNFFVGYQQNPFMETKNQKYWMKDNEQRFHEGDYTQNSFIQKQKTLVKAVNNLSQKNFRRQKNQKVQKWQQISKLSAKTHQNAKKSIISKGMYKSQDQVQQKEQEHSFESILLIEEQSYYVKNQIQINVFQVLKNNHKPFLTNAILDRVYFCHISLMDKITTFRFPIVRELSRIGRKFARDHHYKQPSRLDVINSNEMSFSVGDINFLDLLSVASGRFSPQIVQKTANDIEMRDDSNSLKSQISKLEINYNEHMRQKTTYFENKQVEHLQILEYLRLQKSDEQTKYANKCNKMMKYVASQMEKKSHLTGNTIRDKLLHDEIDKNVNEQLQYMVRMDFKREETEKVIRKNKLKKDRSEAIKIRTLLNSIVLKNRQEEKIKILLQDGARK